MNMKKGLVIIALTLIVLSQSCFGVLSKEWTCIPGERVGLITKEKTEKALINIFGNQNIKTIIINPDEDLGTSGEIDTYIYPNTKNEIKIRWRNQKPWIISIYKEGTQWKTREGITIGTPLNTLLLINKRDFFIAGYGWEYGGWVTSWNNGELSKYNGKLDVFFDAGKGTLKGGVFIGDKKRIKTDNKQLLKAEPKVKSINIIF